LIGKPDGTRPIGKPRHRWEDNIKKGFVWGGMGGGGAWIRLKWFRIWTGGGLF